jgi:hypothetical protein
MRVKVEIDQAVWERTTFYVNISDKPMDEDERAAAIQKEIADYDEYGGPDHEQETLDSYVEGVPNETKATLPDGRTIVL